MNNKRLFVVLGMHRSGTSVITRSLEAAGVELGNNLMQASKDNVKGYFEDIRINELNTELLESLGHKWNTLSLINPKSLKSENLNPIRERAVELLKSEFERTDLFGIKDPRMCRLLPFWMQVFQDLDVDTNYIIVLRDPHSSAASLFNRDAIPAVKSLYMWSLHMIPVLMYTTGLNRVFVNYDALVENPRQAIVNLTKALALEENLTDSSLDTFANEFVDADLRHHKRPDDTARTPAPKLISRLVKLTREIADSPDTDTKPFIDRLKRINSELEGQSELLKYIDTLDEYIIRNINKLNSIEKLVNQLEGTQQTANELLEGKSTLIPNSEIHKSELSLTEALLRNELALQEALSSELIDTRSREEKLKNELSSYEAKLQRRESKLDQQSKAIADQLQRIESLERELTSANDSLEESANQLKHMSAELSKTRRMLEDYVTGTDDLIEKLEEIKSSLFWRISVLSRTFWGQVERLFRKRFRLRLIPANDLNRQKPSEYRWISTGPDPYFRLLPVAGKIPSGWLHIESMVRSDSSDRNVKLYVDLGDGFSEEKAIAIPILPGGRISQFVRIPKDTKSLRWDPLHNPGEFQQFPILIGRKSTISRKLHMIMRVINVLRQTSPNTKDGRHFGWKILFSDLNRAYSTADSIIINRNLSKQ